MKMIRKTHLILAAAAVLMVIVAGTANASNMAFKMNQIIYRAAVNCTSCDQWLSLPFNNQFIGKTIRSAQGLCDTDGDGAAVNDAGDIFEFIAQQGTPANPAQIDTTTVVNCNSPLGANPVYQPTRAIRVRPKGAGANPDINWVVVGSDVPGTQIVVRAPSGGTCSTCNNWIDLVYHATYTTFRTVCDTDGDGDSTPADTGDAIEFVAMEGTATNAARVDSVFTLSCLSPLGANPAVRIGRGLSVRLKSGRSNLLLSQPHF